MSTTTRMAFSPVEEAVLSLLARWWSLEELQREFYPDASPESIKSAIAYLRRNNLIQAVDRQHGTPIYERTELGTQILSERLRERMSALPDPVLEPPGDTHAS